MSAMLNANGNIATDAAEMDPYPHQGEILFILVDSFWGDFEKRAEFLISPDESVKHILYNTDSLEGHFEEGQLIGLW